MYADKITDSMRATMEETNRRREKQLAYNEEHGITPTQIVKATRSIMQREEKKEETYYEEEGGITVAADPVVQYMDKGALEKAIAKAKSAMQKASKNLEFIEAARYRDEMYELEKIMKEKYGK
jgi:excinuclease ABC subunit B